MKRHFTSDYDFIRYKGKVRVKLATFDKRPDKYWFQKVADHHDPHWLLITNLVDDPHRCVGEIVKDTHHYAEHMGRIEALTHTVRRDLEGMDNDICAELSLTAHGHPILARRCLANTVSLETATVISSLTGCGVLWRNSSDQVLKDVGTRLVKYGAFIKFDRDTMRKIVRDHFAVDAPRESM